MKLSFNLLWRGLLGWLLAALLLSSTAPAWQGAATAPAAAAKPSATLTAAERKAAARVRVETIREVTSTLASNEMQGRGTATPGGDRAARYIAERFAKLGLKPLGEAGTYLQAIKFRSFEVLPEYTLKAGDVTLKFGEDFVVAPPFTIEPQDTSGELVFAGYGVVAPDIKRDDLAGLEVKGKIVILLAGRPKNIDEAAWTKTVRPRTIAVGLIGRGAAGVILTNAGSKEQPYSMIVDYLKRRRVAPADAPEPLFKLPPIIIAGDGGAEKLFAGSGMTFAQAVEQAEKGEFVSRAMNKPATIAVRIKREEAAGSNVIGVLEGSDPALKEQALVYTAHYDAYGISSDGRTIYPGAADNALGVAEMTAIAEAFTKSPARPRRSIVFLAVTGEEYGLYGAEHWVRHPTWPIEKVAANLNFDGIGTEIYGPVKNIVGFGAEHSDLGQVLEGAVTATGTKIVPDPLPEEGAFYRSDHYAFVKKGVPALMLLGGPEGEASVWIARAKKWLTTDYHQPTDTVRPDWNWGGARTHAVVGLVTGMRIANQDQMPAWLPASPFNRPRGTNEAPPPRTEK